MGDRAQASRGVSFWVLAVVLALFLFAASAPSPLYRVYAARWHFSSLTVTAVYAVYAAGALVGLLVTGRLSDHIGRRPVAIATVLVQIVGLAAFIAAHGLPLLYVGRVLQGLSTGTASGVFSAWLVDLQPPGRTGFGGVVSSVALLTGLGSGALGSGALVQYAPNPLRLVYWLLLALFVVALAALVFVPDVAPRTPGAVASLRPRVAVPREARRGFLALVPSVIAIWALGGFYLSLGPALAATLLRSDNRVAGGLVIAALMGAAAAASALARAVETTRLLTRGLPVLAIGVAVTLAGVAADSAALLYAGSALAGAGFGPAFAGVLRSTAALAPPDRRGELLATMFVVLYLSFGVPTVLAGLAASHYPLRDTTYVYGGIVVVLAVITALATRRARPAIPPAQLPRPAGPGG
ncbi:MAG: MFS transporter [Frankia sp.]|nr:MFS transporter [Frankia sp.]